MDCFRYDLISLYDILHFCDIFSTTFIQSHFILQEVPCGQWAGICNEMEEIFLGYFRRNIIKKVAFLHTPNPPYRVNSWQTRGSVKNAASILCGSGKEERLKNEERQLVRHGYMPSLFWIGNVEGRLGEW